MERDAVSRCCIAPAVTLGTFLDLDTIWIVGTHLVQRNDVNKHQCHQHERQHEVECIETIQCGIGDNIVTTNPDGQVLTDHRDGREQIDDNLGSPIGHLSPGQQVAHESGRHHGHIDNHANDPQQLAGLTIRTVHESTEHVQINHREEHRGAG